jgi:hypothetical protein
MPVAGLDTASARVSAVYSQCIKLWLIYEALVGAK